MFNEIIEIEDIQKELLNINLQLGLEEVNIMEAFNRVLGEDIYSNINYPSFDKSLLDGYAVKSEDTKGANAKNPILLEVVDEVCAGHIADEKVEKGSAVRIMTGAPVPEGTDCIVGQENIEFINNKKIKVFLELLPYDNYCCRGSYIKKGELLLKKGCIIKSDEIAVLASIGRKIIKVFQKPKVSVLCTGDELVDIKDELKQGKVYNSNLYSLVAKIKQCQAEPIILGIASDNKKQITQKIQEGMKKSDIIVTTGGVSFGIKDLLKKILTDLKAQFIFSKVNMKPGTYTYCSILNDKIIFSLSGSPTASSISFDLFVRPLLAKISYRQDLDLVKVKAIFNENYVKKNSCRRITKGILLETPQGKYVTIKDIKNINEINIEYIFKWECLIDFSKSVDFGQPVEVFLIR